MANKIAQQAQGRTAGSAASVSNMSGRGQRRWDEIRGCAACDGAMGVGGRGLPPYSEVWTAMGVGGRGLPPYKNAIYRDLRSKAE
jgi:hypothetical protein